MFYYIKPWIYPILLEIQVIIACLTPYLKATHDGTVTKDLPYISDTGDTPTGVAASAFTFLFNIYGLIALITIGIRFEQVRITYNFKEYRYSFIMNLLLLFAGITSTVGVFIVAAFQISTNETMHNLGAGATFSIGVGYMVIQTICSFFWRKLPGSHIITNLIRVVLSLLSSAFLLGAFILVIKYKQSNQDAAIKREAAILEWCMAFSLTSFFLTYIPEFFQYDWKINFIQKQTKCNKVSNSESTTDQENME